MWPHSIPDARSSNIPTPRPGALEPKELVDFGSAAGAAAAAALLLLLHPCWGGGVPEVRAIFAVEFVDIVFFGFLTGPPRSANHFHSLFV